MTTTAPPRPARQARLGRVAVVGVIAVVAGLALGGQTLVSILAPEVVAAQAQQDASAVLSARGAAPVGDAPIGTPLGRITIPRLGDHWTWVVFEGVDQPTLAKGPGHYPGAGEPGRPGNYAIAGHRVGGPFDGAAALQPCDPIMVATATSVYTYRVLPIPGVVSPGCTLSTVNGLPGQQVVTPTDIGVIETPPAGAPAAAGKALLTITTCNPRFSARQRLIIHAVLTDTQPAVP